MKKLLILGAGVYQVPLIKKANELGFRTIVVSYKGNYPGLKISDKNYYIDTTNSERIVEIAKKERISGVCTSGTDVPIITLSKISRELGLPGLSEKSALLSTNKLLMKEAFHKNNVRTAKFILIKDINNINKKINCLRMPLMLKVVDSSGSRGLFKIYDSSNIDNAVARIKTCTKKDYFIIEEFLKGVEFGAQAFVYKGKIKFILPHGDFTYKGDVAVPIGHFVPIRLKKDIIEDLNIQLERAVRSLELDNCAINADFILKNNKIFVLEIGARAGATCLPELVSIYYGFNYYETIIKVAVGEKPNISFKFKQPNASKLIISKKTGIIKNIKNINSIKNDIIEIKFDYNVGEKINRFKVGPDRAGHIIVKGRTLKESLKLLNEVKKNIIIEVR